MCNVSTDALIDQELHSVGLATLAETQDVGSSAKILSIDVDLMLSFSETAHALGHHHAARHVEHLVADIAGLIDLEAEDGLTSDRVRIEVHGNGIVNSRGLRHTGELLLIVLAAEDAASIGGSIDDTCILDTRIDSLKVTFVGMVHRDDILSIVTLLLEFHHRNLTHGFAVEGPGAEVLASVDTTFGTDDDITRIHVNDRGVDGHLRQIALLRNEGRLFSHSVGGIEHIVIVAIVTTGEQNLVFVARVNADRSDALAIDGQSELGDGAGVFFTCDGASGAIDNAVQTGDAEELSILETDEHCITVRSDVHAEGRALEARVVLISQLIPNGSLVELQGSAGHKEGLGGSDEEIGSDGVMYLDRISSLER